MASRQPTGVGGAGAVHGTVRRRRPAVEAEFLAAERARDPDAFAQEYGSGMIGLVVAATPRA
jgi:hypothetical protein